MAKVFVSYSRKDIEFAKQLTAELQKGKLDFWIDWEGIPPTVDWWREIEKGIEEADVFIFLISPDSAKSKICGKEIDTAVKNGKRIIPVVVREIQWEDTPPQLGHLNYIFFSRDDVFDAAVKKLMTAIQTDYEWAATHRRLQVKALDWERNNKDGGFLLRGADLLDAEQDLAINTSKDPYPTDLQREFVFNSRKATDRQRRLTTSVSIVVAIALAALAAFAFYQAGVASEREKIARSGELSAQAIEIRERDFQVSLLLGVEGFLSADTVQARRVLLDGFNKNPLIQYLSRHHGAINALAYSPDKKILASGSDDGMIIFWDVATHQPVGQPLVGHESAITQLAFSPDGKLLASGGCAKDSSNGWVDDCNNGEIILWDVDTRKPIQHLVGYRLFYDVLAFSPDGRTIGFLSTAYSRNKQPYIALWDVMKLQPTSLIDTDTTSLAFSPDGKTIATSGANDGFTPVEITLWDVEKGTRIDQIETGSESGIEQMIFKDNNTLIVLQASLTIWNVGTHESSELEGVDYERSIVTSVALSVDGSTVAAAIQTPGLAEGDDHSSIQFWSMDYFYTLGDARLTGHSDFVDTMAFSQDGKTLAFEGINNAAVLWDVVIASECCGSVYPPLGYYLQEADLNITDASGVIFDPTGKYLAAGMGNNEIRVWDIQSQVLIEPSLTGQEFAFSRDGKYIVTTNSDGITLQDTASWNTVGQISTTGDISALAFSRDGKVLITGDQSATSILLWDVSDILHPEAAKQPTGRNFGNSSGMKIAAMAVSANGKWLAAGSDQGVTIWNLKTGQQIKTLTGYSSDVFELVFSSDSKVLAAGDGVNVIVWDLEKMEQIGASFYGFGFALSPDGRFLATLNSDAPGINQIILWDITTHRSIGNPMFENYAEMMIDLTYRPDGNTLVSSSINGAIILWNMDPKVWTEQACQRADRNFTPDEWTLYFPNEEYRRTCEQWDLESEVTSTPAP